jgi:pimeloyl-ACP methyl ester carboxylesterase
VVVPRRVVWERDGVRLAALDFGGDGPGVLLLHGLVGYAGEWAETARWLTERCQVVALDARGHGSSERRPADGSRQAHVADATFAVERLGLDPVLVVGRSLGGQAAFLLAANRPDLVRAVVLVEANPGAGDETTVAAVHDSLQRWPVPFPSHQAAVGFFGGPSLRARVWADGLEPREDGLWPRFDIDVMVATLREAAGRAYWDEWERIECPALVARAENGIISAADAAAMTARGGQVRLVEIPHAGHDLQLERPNEWRRVLTDFLDGLP